MAESRKILYWHGVVGDVLLREQYSKVLEKLMNGEYAAAKYHKLKDYDVYSVYEDGKDRLIVTTEEIDGKPYLLVLKALPDHDYHHLDKTVLKRYIERNREQIIAQARAEAKEEKEEKEEKKDKKVEWEEVDEKAIAKRFGKLKSISDMPIHFSPADYQQDKCIEYNEKQKDFISTMIWGRPGFRKRKVLLGPAGSGKSLLALVMAENYEDDVVYLTPTEALARDMEDKFNVMRAGKPALNHAIEFLSLKEFIRKLHPEMDDEKKWRFVDKSDFLAWLPAYCGRMSAWAEQQKKNQVLAQLQQRADEIYQEFMSLSVHESMSDEDYQARGEWRAIFKKGVERELVWKVYQAYKDNLENKKQVDANLFKIKLAEQKKLLVVDEAHDFPLHDLCYFASIFRDIVYIADPHQRTASALPVMTDLEERLGKETVDKYTLTDPERYSDATIRFINAVLEIDYIVTGGKSEKGEYTAIESTEKHKKKAGEGRWVKTTEPAELKKMIDELLKKYSIRDEIAVIIPNENEKTREESHLAAVKEWFPGKLIFTADQSKGLQYPVVILDAPLEQEKLYQLNTKYREKKKSGAVAAQKQKINQAKDENREISFKTATHELVTMVSRNQEIFIVVQAVKGKRKIDEIADRLMAAIIPQTSSAPALSPSPSAPSIAPVAKTDDERSLEQARIQVRLGNDRVARDIYIDQLGKSEREFEEFKRLHSPEKRKKAQKPAELKLEETKTEVKSEKRLVEHPKDKAKIKEHRHEDQQKKHQTQWPTVIKADVITADMLEQRYQQLRLYDYIVRLYETFTENNLRVFLCHKSCIKLLFGYVEKQIQGQSNLFYAIVNNEERRKLFFDFINDKKNSETVSKFYDKLAQELHLSPVIDDQSDSQPFAASVLYHLTGDTNGIDILSTIFNQYHKQEPEWLKHFSQTLCQCFQFPNGYYGSAFLHIIDRGLKSINIIFEMAEQYPALLIDLRKILFKHILLMNGEITTILHCLVFNLPMNSKSADFVLKIFNQQPELLKIMSNKELILQVVRVQNGNRCSLFSNLACLCPSFLAAVIEQSDTISEENIVDELFRFIDSYTYTPFHGLAIERNHITLKVIIKKYPGIISRFPRALLCEPRLHGNGHIYPSLLFHLCKDSDMEVACKIADAQPDLLKHLTLQQLCEKVVPYLSQPLIDSLLIVWFRNRKANVFFSKWLLAHPQDTAKFNEHVHEYQRKQYTKDMSLLISKNLMVAQSSLNSGQVENIPYKLILELYNHFNNENLSKILTSPVCIQLLFGFVEKGVNGHSYLFSAIVDQREKNKLFFDFIKDEKNSDIIIHFKKNLFHNLFQVQMIENSLQERQLRMTPFHCLSLCLEGIDILADLFRSSSGIATDSLINALFQLIIKVNAEDFVSIFFILIYMPCAKGVALLHDMFKLYPDVLSRIPDTELYRLVKLELYGQSVSVSTFSLLLNSALQGKGVAFLNDIYKQQPNLLKALPGVVLFQLLNEANGTLATAFTRLSLIKDPLFVSIIEQNDYITEENIATELFRYIDKCLRSSLRYLSMEKNHTTLKAIIKKFPNIVYQIPRDLLYPSITEWNGLKHASILFFLCFNDRDMEVACKIVASQPDLLKHLSLTLLCEKIVPALELPLVDSLLIVWSETKKGRALLKQWLKEHPEDKGAVEEHIRVYQQKKDELESSSPLVNFSIFTQQDEINKDAVVSQPTVSTSI